MCSSIFLFLNDWHVPHHLSVLIMWSFVRKREVLGYREKGETEVCHFRRKVVGAEWLRDAGARNLGVGDGSGIGSASSSSTQLWRHCLCIFRVAHLFEDGKELCVNTGRHWIDCLMWKIERMWKRIRDGEFFFQEYWKSQTHAVHTSAAPPLSFLSQVFHCDCTQGLFCSPQFPTLTLVCLDPTCKKS